MGFFPDIGRHEQRVIKLRTVGDFSGPASQDRASRSPHERNCKDPSPRNSVTIDTQRKPSSTPLISRRGSVDSIDLRDSAFILALESAKAHFEPHTMKIEDSTSMSLSDLRQASMPNLNSLPKIRGNVESSRGFLSPVDSSTAPITLGKASSRTSISATYNSSDRALKPSTSTPYAEDNVLRVAASLGVVTKEGLSSPFKMSGDLKTALGSNRGGINSKASTASQQYLSTQGVQLSALIRFADTVSHTYTVSDVINKLIKPQTASSKSRYIDMIQGKKDSPGYYVVYSRSMNFHALVETLRLYLDMNKHLHEEQYVWIDVFCVNQHVAELVPQEIDSVADVIHSTSKVLFVLDEAGEALKRTWVLFELWQAHLSSRKQDKLVVLPAAWSWEGSVHAFVSMDVSSSRAVKALERTVLMDRLQKQVDLPQATEIIKNALVTGAKLEMFRTERLSNLSVHRYIDAATTYAMMLYHQQDYAEAEEVLGAIKTAMEKTRNRELIDQVEPYNLLHLSQIFHEKGQILEEQRVLTQLSAFLFESEKRVFLEGTSKLVTVLLKLKLYTKAELLCRKLQARRIDIYGGKQNVGIVTNMLQLSQISMAQGLYDEAEDCASDALTLSVNIEGVSSLNVASCHHALASCFYARRQPEQAVVHLNKALNIRRLILGDDHPLTLELLAMEATALINEQQLNEAAQKLANIRDLRLATYGREHHETLKTVGALVDLYCQLQRNEEAEEGEALLLETGKLLLRRNRIDKFLSLQFVAMYLAGREDLIEKAAPYLAKAYVTFKEKLGLEADMTVSTKKKLENIVDRERVMAFDLLEEGQLYQRQEALEMAEMMFKQCWSFAKLVHPEADHKDLAQGLSDALFSQGKSQEAMTVLRSAGLAKKGMSENMPASYLRWLNKRVEKYMDKGSAGNKQGA
ncbi:hypothetical protein CEUSTIGMA_g13385.t1 [Chlamydomonas eustigma]|uniref:Heterokaryon incompatibility domain-containing protein n=1 Tax=Chlamydomonas eustigma TaxID=1157962 RepID=A0A250XSN2_9CHLO|nr:hypothetical protein CEUSTIGMA_g13385.t1 [Chlamydomonas eustigma]|eukprot:GAX85969.1 hypothetical protein CEUSTIGMA_g13385.t1 [Chlamydomonas eustigma]